MVFTSFFLLHLSSWLLARFICLISTSFLCYIVLSVLKARQRFYDSLLLNLGIHQISQCSRNEKNCLLEHWSGHTDFWVWGEAQSVVLPLQL